MYKATVVIPVAPHHAGLSEQAMASVEAQTVPTRVITVDDYEQKGPGWARNAGLARVETPFVVFLDADDVLAPTFVEETLALAQRDHYVYTDWYNGQKLVQAPECADWSPDGWHPVTTLLPTNWAKRVGGFEENFPGAEDTDFYKKLLTSGCCGIRCPQPLVLYAPGGQRSKAFHEGDYYDVTMAEIMRRYGGKRMSCCGKKAVTDVPPQNGRQEGDILAQSLWKGNRVIRGLATGRNYGRMIGHKLRGTGNGRLLWVDPRDVQRMPRHFRPVEREQPEPEPPMSFEEFGRVLQERMKNPPFKYEPPPRHDARPDWAAMVRRGQEALGG